MKNRKTRDEKPYQKCLSCPHRKVRCDGPRTSSLPLDKWCEWMRDLKEVNGLTNAEIAENAEVSIKTIERIMTGRCEKDIRRDTARRIENVIIGSANNNPCYLAFEEETAPIDQKLEEALARLEAALADNMEYRKALDDIHKSHAREIATLRADTQKQKDFLIEQVKKLRMDNDNLWKEVNRKADMIDRLISGGKILP